MCIKQKKKVFTRIIKQCPKFAIYPKSLQVSTVFNIYGKIYLYSTFTCIYIYTFE